jgi:hypothetical protein
MGMWDTVKGWFNIGGVRVKIQDRKPQVSRSGNTINAKVSLTTKTDKQILKVKYIFLWKKTTGKGAEQKTEQQVFGTSTMDAPFELKAGETKVIDLRIDYTMPKRLQDMGGMLGAMGKLGAFATHEKDQYLVTAEASVKGAAFAASDTMQVSLVD